MIPADLSGRPTKAFIRSLHHAPDTRLRLMEDVASWIAFVLGALCFLHIETIAAAVAWVVM